MAEAKDYQAEIASHEPLHPLTHHINVIEREWKIERVVTNHVLYIFYVITYIFFLKAAEETTPWKKPLTQGICATFLTSFLKSGRLIQHRYLPSSDK